MEAIATMISAIVAAVALVLTYVQFRKRVKIEHAQQVLKMQESTRNEEIVAFFRMIDYGENRGWYNGFHENEKLVFIGNLCWTVKNSLTSCMKLTKLLVTRISNTIFFSCSSTQNRMDTHSNMNI